MKNERDMIGSGEKLDLESEQAYVRAKSLGQYQVAVS